MIRLDIVILIVVATTISLDSIQCKDLESTPAKVAGHQGRIRPGTRPNTLLKMVAGNEKVCFHEIKSDKMAYLVPKLYDSVQLDRSEFLEIQDLLAGFSHPSVMDAKMGVRTFKESEMTKELKLRQDLYQKLVAVDPREPNEEENKAQAITKARYMMWRDSATTSASLGFRIEGIHYGDGRVEKDFKTVRDAEPVREALRRFVGSSDKIRRQYLNRLLTIRRILGKSSFFKSHELVGSSLLFVHDETRANIWMIDFAETQPLPEGVSVTHQASWRLGNHEDGYLIGLDNLITMFSEQS